MEPEIAASIVRRPSMERSRMRLHLDPVVPPPPPPRTVTLIKPTVHHQPAQAIGVYN